MSSTANDSDIEGGAGTLGLGHPISTKLQGKYVFNGKYRLLLFSGNLPNLKSIWHLSHLSQIVIIHSHPDYIAIIHKLPWFYLAKVKQGVKAPGFLVHTDDINLLGKEGAGGDMSGLQECVLTEFNCCLFLKFVRLVLSVAA